MNGGGAHAEGKGNGERFGTTVVFAVFIATHRNSGPASPTRWEQCRQSVIVIPVNQSEVLDEVVFSLKAIFALIGRAFRAWVLRNEILIRTSNVPP
ncbi:hypothetical protein ANO14919_078930 [Xylariales sp. No.14919]|nr:hypothetical protein ANO14919_078930 [Xylariales sp. No.14919]